MMDIDVTLGIITFELYTSEPDSFMMISLLFSPNVLVIIADVQSDPCFSVRPCT